MTIDYRELIAVADGWQSRPCMCDACGRPVLWEIDSRTGDGTQQHAIAAAIGCELIPAESRPDDSAHPSYVIAARAWSDRLTEEDRDRAAGRMRQIVREWVDGSVKANPTFPQHVDILVRVGAHAIGVTEEDMRAVELAWLTTVARALAVLDTEVAPVTCADVLAFIDR